MTCTVSGPLVDPTGALLPNTDIVFVWVPQVAGNGEATVVGRDVSAISDVDGVVSVDLEPGQYKATINATRGVFTFAVGVPDETTAALHDCIEQTPVLTPSLVAQAAASATAASGSATAAAASATSAAASSTSAGVASGRLVAATYAEFTTKYGASAGRITPAVGDIVQVVAIGAAYERVASGGHLTIDGLQWRVLPVDGEMLATAFGVVVDNGTVDNAVALTRWRDAAIAGGYDMRLPADAGKIYSSQAITLPHTGSYYRMDTGIRLIGGGPLQVLTRKDTAPSNFVNTAVAGLSVAAGAGVTEQTGRFFKNNTGSAIVLTGASAASLVSSGLTEVWQDVVDESFFAVFGSNYEIDGLYFEDCRRGIVFMQDPARVGVENSHTSFNHATRIFAKNCSVGVTIRAAEGAYYNSLEDSHIAQCQIGYDFGNLIGTVDNVNRNLFSGLRAARCHVGFYIRTGDTNTFSACHTEGCGATPTSNRYSSPAGLPDGRATWSWINDGSKNRFLSCVDEGGDQILYNNDPEAIYIATLFGEYTAASTKVLFAQRPLVVENDRTVWERGGNYSDLSNINTNAFPARPAGPFFNTQVRFTGGIRHSFDVLGANKTGAIEAFFDLGAVASGGTAAFDLWQNATGLEDRREAAAAIFDVDVLGDSQTNSLVHNTKFRVLALRNGSGTLTRYHVLDLAGGRATGVNTGDTAEAFGPALSVVSGRLVCTLTAPGRTFERVFVSVRARFART